MENILTNFVSGSILLYEAVNLLKHKSKIKPDNIDISNCHREKTNDKYAKMNFVAASNGCLNKA